MTIGLSPAADGKVGCIRLVDLGTSTDPHFSTYATTTNIQPTSVSQDGAKPYTPPSGRKINMLEIGVPYSKEKEDEIKTETKIVLAHGYGAGSGFFFQNIESMAKIPNSRLYVLDWLGMGRSSRPTFHIPSSETKSTETRVAAAESFFISSLEDWRQKMGLEKMVLVGHSFLGPVGA